MAKKQKNRKTSPAKKLSLIVLGILALSTAITLAQIQYNQNSATKAVAYDNSISGVVFYDKDGNGRQNYAGGETGVAGAHVAWKNTTTGANGGTNTTSSGSIYFPNLGSGSYVVTIYPPNGYHTISGTSILLTLGGSSPKSEYVVFRLNKTSSSPAPGGGGSGNQPSIAPRASSAPQQPNCYRVSGYVFYDADVNGSKGGATQEPYISGARITFFQGNSSNIVGSIVTTNSEGKFAASCIPPGSTTMRVQHNDYLEHSDGVVVSASTPTVKIGVPRRRTSSPPIVSGSPNANTCYVFAGNVFKDTNGDGAKGGATTEPWISGATVKLNNGQQATTNSTGRFTMSCVKPGRYTPTITHPSYTTLIGNGFTIRDQGVSHRYGLRGR